MVGGLIAQCLREGRDFPDTSELVSALRQQYQVGGQEAKAFLARSRPTQATLNASGRDSCLARVQNDALCLALEVQHELTKT